ncbi:MAG: DUF4402 domain-containing protein [Gemmatimonadales bacterium]
MRFPMLAAAMLLGAGAVSAQSASITARANVFTPLVVTGAQDLDFQNVFPGAAKTVGVAAPSAGRFDITGQANAPVSLTFALPTNLTNGGNTLPIGSWTGCRNATNTATACTTLTPSATATNASFGAAGTMFVFVGGTVTPAPSQSAGVYTGTVQLTVAYL